MLTERDYCLWLSTVKGLGPLGARKLIVKFGSAKEVFLANKKQLCDSRLSEKLISAILNTDKNIEGLKKILIKKGVWFKVLGDIGMPEIFEHFDDLPFVIFGIGSEMALNMEYSLSVVGSRRMTDYGQTQLKLMLGELLKDLRVTIVSGMARGIDAAAHWAAINSGAKTVVVLGCGVDVCYPIQNKALYDKIIESGSVIISEYFPGTLPVQGSFPARNRIIAAISSATFIVEAGLNSGTLITAREALNYGKNLGVLPGRVDMPNSLGALRLIKDGAEPITSSADLRDLIGLPLIKKEKTDLESSIIFNILVDGPKHFDEIAESSEIERTLLIIKVEELVDEDFLTNLGAGYYAKS